MDYKLLSHTYKNKKVFLTGHTGFKGTWLLNWLHILGAQVKGYSLAPEGHSSLYNIVKGDDLCESVISDIRDNVTLESAILDFQPDFIFHLAAQPLVRLSYKIPIETFSVNAIGTACILDVVRLLNKPCAVILITTDKVYENNEWHFPYREIDRLGGYDPYSASKACAEIIINSYRNSFFHPDRCKSHYKSIASARAGNVIGGGDWALDRIIPDTIKALQNQSEIAIRNPNSIRPWQHVLESLSGYLLLGAKMIEDPVKYANCWNFGPKENDNLSVETLVKISIQTWGSGHYSIDTPSNQLHEAGLLKLDISRAINLLGWQPRYNSTTAIEKTIVWYKNFYLMPHKGRDLVQRDILEYINENN